jgi:hypothetical protein
MKNLLALVAGAVMLSATDGSVAQNGHMMNGAMPGSGWIGGYIAMWLPIVLFVVVVGLVIWAVRRGGN